MGGISQMKSVRIWVMGHPYILILLFLTNLSYSTGQNYTCLYISTNKANPILSHEYKELQGLTKEQCEADFNDIREGVVSCFDDDDDNTGGGRITWKMKCLSAGLLKKYNVRCDDRDVKISCKSNSSCLNGGTIIPDESNCLKNPPEIKCQCPSAFYGNMCQYVHAQRICEEYQSTERDSNNSCASDPKSQCFLAMRNRFYRCGEAIRDDKELPPELLSCENRGNTAGQKEESVPQPEPECSKDRSPIPSIVVACVSMAIAFVAIVLCVCYYRKFRKLRKQLLALMIDQEERPQDEVLEVENGEVLQGNIPLQHVERVPFLRSRSVPA